MWPLIVLLITIIAMLGAILFVLVDIRMALEAIRSNSYAIKRELESE